MARAVDRELAVVAGRHGDGDVSSVDRQVANGCPAAYRSNVGRGVDGHVSRAGGYGNLGRNIGGQADGVGVHVNLAGYVIAAVQRAVISRSGRSSIVDYASKGG